MYAEFSVRYDQSLDHTSATATFWKDNRNGRQLVFAGDAQLTFQGVTMEYRSNGYYYASELEKYRSPAIFSVTDINQKNYTNSITMNKVDYPSSVSLDTIDSSKPLTVTWSGTALENNETVTFRIESIGASATTQGSTSLLFSVANFATLSSFKNKNVVVSLERLKKLPLQQDLGGNGNITALYVTQQDTVYLK